MEPRLNLSATATGAKFTKYLIAANRVLLESSVPTSTLLLVDIRASQINGCAYCVDMHTKDALADGETQTRLNLVATWREADCFTEAERAALELAEEGSRLADASTKVGDETWNNAAEHYDEEQLAALVCQIALINAFNRGNVITRRPAGDYVPGQFAPHGRAPAGRAAARR